MDCMPKSRFIIDEIRKRSFSVEKDRLYIEDLCLLEKSLTQDIVGWAGNMKLDRIKSEYEREYHAIFRELKPVEFVKYMKKKRREEKRDKIDQEEFEREIKDEEKKAKAKWLDLGGKP